MIAVDTNILVYAHRGDSAWHDRADQCLSDLAESGTPFAIPWPCLHEFIAIATHARIYDPPSPLDEALVQVEYWLEAPGMVLLGEDERYWPRLREILWGAQVTGPLVHDARVAALCARHGVGELWTADRDFSRFPGLKTRNPLVQAAPRRRTRTQ